MRRSGPFQGIALPNHWPEYIKWAIIETISLAHRAITYSRSYAVNSKIERVRLAGELDELRAENAMLREEIRIKDSRMAKIRPRNRPHYLSEERMAILELKAARAWNLVETSRTFLLEPDTVSCWIERTAAHDDSLLQIPDPVNKYPEYVRYIVKKLKVLCPTLGKRKIADTLAMAGLHLGATSVWRFIKEPPLAPKPDLMAIGTQPTGQVVISKYPNHVWHVDLTTVPTSGYWVPWWPFSISQVAPFGWWILVILDQFSRVVVGYALFPKQPTSKAVREAIAEAIDRVGRPPKYLISDQGKQFIAQTFKKWCRGKPRKIRQRFGAIGQYGSIAMVERVIRTMKNECTRRILVPLRPDGMREELTLFVHWYNEHRPHQGLGGRIPMDVYFGVKKKPVYFETRGDEAIPLRLVVSYHGGRKHLPIVELQEAA